MNKQNGFAPIVAIITLAIVTLAVSGGLYYVNTQKGDSVVDRSQTKTKSPQEVAPGSVIPPFTSSTSTDTQATTSVGQPTQPAAGPLDCKTDIDCLIRAAATCRLATATTTSSLSMGSLTQKTKTAHEIRGIDSGVCMYQTKILDIQYTSTDTSAAGKAALDRVRQASQYMINAAADCIIPTEDLVGRLDNLKRGVVSAEFPDPYCVSAASQAQPRTTLSVQPGVTIGSTIGSQKVKVQYTSATDTSATLTVTVGATSKVLTFVPNKEVVFSGIVFKVTSIKPSSISPSQKQVDIELAEQK